MQPRTLWEALVAGEPGIILGVSLLGVVLTGASLLMFRSFRRSFASVRADASDPDQITVQQLKDQHALTQHEWLERRVSAYRREFHAQAEQKASPRAAQEDARHVAPVDEIGWPTLDDENAAEETPTFAAIPAMEPEPATPVEIPAPRRAPYRRRYIVLQPRPHPSPRAKVPT
jgi:hypothetical protein